MATDPSNIIIVIPTYNERGNIVPLARALAKVLPGAAMLVVDDHSPDGTAVAVQAVQRELPNLQLLERPGPRGFGRSYQDGFRQVLAGDYEAVVMMDADFSHNPATVPAMLARLGNYDVVIGSRYIKDGGIAHWGWRRRWLSRFASFYTKLIIGLPVNDFTTGFMALRQSVLAQLDLEAINSDGYAFLVELKYRLAQAGCRLVEHPIVFNERREGQSKMSARMIWESVWLPWQLKLASWRKHWLAWLLAALFGLSLVLPQFYYQQALGPLWQGINRQIGDDSLLYLARIHEVLDGHPAITNAYLAEHKMNWPQSVFLAEYLLAQPLKWFGLTVAQGQRLYNFLWPFCTWLLTYLALWLVTQSRRWALVGTAGLVAGMFWLNWLRPVSPQFNFLFWLWQFILTWLVARPSARPGAVPLAVLNLGLLFYIYPYYWSFYLVWYGLLFWFYFRFQRQLSWRLLKISLGGLLVGAPYFYYTYLASKLPGFEETLTRVQLIYTHFPSGIWVLAWAAGLLAGFWLARQLNKFFISGALAAILVVNQHLLTGRNFEFSSHYYPLTVFLAVFGLFYLLSHLPKRASQPVWRLVLALVLFSLAISGWHYGQRLVTFDRGGEQRYAPVLAWLNQHTAPDSVVYADEALSQLIPVYTADNVFYSRYANLFFMTDAEVQERFIINNYFAKFDQDFALANERAIFGVRYVDQFAHAGQENKLRKLLGWPLVPAGPLPEPAISQFLTLARALQQRLLAELLKPYRADYFVFGAADRTQLEFEQLKLGSLVYRDHNFVIYRR